MKKFKAFVILGVVLLFSACKPAEKAEEVDLSVIEEKLVPPEKAKTLADLYTARYDILKDSLHFDDNRSSWYSLAELENYILYSKREAKRQGYEITGFRIYPGVNPEIGDAEGNPYTTFFLVPTRAGKQKGSFFAFQIGGNEDTNLPGLDYGGSGDPPQANYPQ